MIPELRSGKKFPGGGGKESRPDPRRTVILFIGPFSFVVTVYLIIQFNSPFQGRLRVTPKAFESIADVVPPVVK